MGLPAGVAAILMLGGLVLGLLYTAWDPVRDGGAPALPPVASDAARVGKATARQPVSLERLSAAQDLERLLVVESSRGSAAAALDALVNVWGYSASLDQEIDPNLFAGVVSEFSSLRVFATRSTRAQLERVNLPAILELELSLGERRYAAVLGLEGDGRALLALGPRSFQVSSVDLDRLWTGRTFFLWTNFESLPALAPGMNGSAVRWLQARLTDLGYLQRGDASGEFDAHTAGAMRRFQTEYELEQPGEVGPDSLIALYQALQYEAPRLTWEKEGS